jgi:hypothetical protein
MDRKIQFKGKRTDNGQYIIGFFLGLNPLDPDITFIGYGHGIIFHTYSNSVGQFTGLKTGTNNDIFENDTFIYKKHDGYLYDDFQGQIKFKDGCFGFIPATGNIHRQFIPFCEIDELQSDFLNHITIIDQTQNNISYPKTIS